MSDIRITFPGQPPPADGYQVGDMIAYRRIGARRLRDLRYWRVTGITPPNALDMEPLDLVEHPDPEALERWVFEYLDNSPREPTT
jgi:hypothetical protein